LIERLVKAGVRKGLSSVEAYSIESDLITLTVSRGRVKEASRSQTISIGVRGSLGKRVGGITLSTLKVSPDEAADMLLKITRASPEDPYWSGFPPEAYRLSEAVCLDNRIATISEDEVMELLSDTIRVAEDASVRSGAESALVVESSLNIGLQRFSVANSNGVNQASQCSLLSMWLTLSVKTSRGDADRSMFIVKRGLDKKYIMEKAGETGSQAPLFAGADMVESGTYDLILTPEATGLLLSTVLTPAFSALNILESRSPLANKIREPVFSPQVSIIDDPLIPLEAGSRGFDDEGVGTLRKHIVNNGMFAQPLHSYYTATRMNEQPTGNGFRRAPGSPAQPGATNLVLQSVKGGLDDFINEARRALVVYEMIGYWMSNPVNGSVKATVSHGLLVENGKVVKPVKGVVISGNMYEWLSNKLVAVGSDLVVNNGVGSPSIWVSNVNIAGR